MRCDYDTWDTVSRIEDGQHRYYIVCPCGEHQLPVVASGLGQTDVATGRPYTVAPNLLTPLDQIRLYAPYLLKDRRGPPRRTRRRRGAHLLRHAISVPARSRG